MPFIFAANFSTTWTLPPRVNCTNPPPPILSYTTGNLHFVTFHLAFYLQLYFVFSQNRTLPDPHHHSNNIPQYQLVLLVTCSLKINTMGLHLCVPASRPSIWRTRLVHPCLYATCRTSHLSHWLPSLRGLRCSSTFSKSSERYIGR